MTTTSNMVSRWATQLGANEAAFLRVGRAFPPDHAYPAAAIPRKRVGQEWPTYCRSCEDAGEAMYRGSSGVPWTLHLVLLIGLMFSPLPGCAADAGQATPAAGRFTDMRPGPGWNRAWAASDGGLLLFDEASGKLLRKYTRRDGLPSNRLTELLPMPDGTLWIASLRGVARLRGDDITVFSESEGLTDGRVYCVAAGPDGLVYVGTHRGICRLDGQRFEPVNDTHEFARRPTYHIHAAGDGTLWFAKKNALTCRRGPGKWETFQNDPLRRGRRGKIVSNSLLCVTTDSQHRPWVGTKLGIGCYAGLSWRHIFYRERLFKGGIADNRIVSLDFDARGRLWLSHGDSRDFDTALGVGVLETTRPDAPCSYLTTADGLPSDCVYRVRIDEQDRAWLATSQGGCCVEGGRITLYQSGVGVEMP
ncbi:hypothetical protein ACFLSJ_05365 [Verrucomicrobiota bacterium]